MSEQTTNEDESQVEEQSPADLACAHAAFKRLRLRAKQTKQASPAKAL